MSIDNLKLWNDFKKALLECTKETSPNLVDKAWNSNGDRTEFYFNLILPKIASKLDLQFETEKVFRVDATFYKEAHGFHVPIVYIESENDADDTEREIYKLCCLNAPLKILFICTEWNEARRNDLTTDYWHYITEAFTTENQLVGRLGIIVAEWLDDLRFISFSYDSNGVIDADEILT